MTETAYEGWARVELMGHRTRVGRIREVEMYGTKMLRISEMEKLGVCAAGERT